jgi:hypothetical protein
MELQQNVEIKKRMLGLRAHRTPSNAVRRSTESQHPYCAFDKHHVRTPMRYSAPAIFVSSQPKPIEMGCQLNCRWIASEFARLSFHRILYLAVCEECCRIGDRHESAAHVSKSAAMESRAARLAAPPGLMPGGQSPAPTRAVAHSRSLWLGMFQEPSGGH